MMGAVRKILLLIWVVGLVMAGVSLTRAHAQPAPDYRGALADGQGKSLATQWPIVLSHPFSYNAEMGFRGDTLQPDGKFNAYGVKQALEADGAVVYQPDKMAFASHEIRGQLFYKKCAGPSTIDRLCLGRNATVIDGIEHATLAYCSEARLRERSGFSSEEACRKGLKFNIICHSQGCPDSRYMMAAVRQSFSGELMYKHVASWSSLVGANKGTAIADFYLKISASCLTQACRTNLLDAVLGLAGVVSNNNLLARAGDSVVALSRRYMLDSTDIHCKPTATVKCPPSFNERYHLMSDEQHPVLYQTFNAVIRDRAHPCFKSWSNDWQMKLLDREEGENDGYISLESQRFTTYGRNGSGGSTPVVARDLAGYSLDPARVHPGLNHMAFADTPIPGMGNGTLSCKNEDNRHLRFSREAVYRDIVAELVERGY